MPDLAESWQVEQAGAVYRFRLREGVKWHDGARVHVGRRQVQLRGGAAQVPRANQGLDGRGAGRHRGARRPHGRVPLQAAVRAALLQQLDATEAPIVAKHVYQGSDPQTNPANASPVGTGPFKFVAYKKGAEIRLARNPTYFKQGLPYLDEVVMRVIPDPATQVLALENGEVDFLWGVPGPQQSRLTADARFRMAQTAYHPGGSNCIMTVSFNLDRPILKDAAGAAGASRHALDREAFLTQVLFGEGKVATAPISSEIPWAHAAG